MIQTEITDQLTLAFLQDGISRATFLMFAQ
jgi:hypothetical protein